MQIVNFLVVQCAFFRIVRSAPADDMQSLSESCENAANVLDSSLNTTMAMNTSGLIQEIMWQVGASTANLQTNVSTNASSALDLPYFDVC